MLARNVHLKGGEIDLIVEAPDGRTIVIVEVKAAQVSGDGESAEGSRIYPEAHVNAAKRRKLVHLASQAVKRYGWRDRPVRFDVVGVDLPARGKPVVRHHVGAFKSHV